MTVTLNQQTLISLMSKFSFDIKEMSEITIFGIRGASISSGDFSKGQSVSIIQSDVDFDRMRCVLIALKKNSGEITAAKGSTVPNKKYIKSSKHKGGEGTNMVLAGFYPHTWEKGIHKPGSRTAHRALRQRSNRVITRTGDDYDYDSKDPIYWANPFDNLHAAWSSDRDFASAGCTVIAGFPESPSSKPSGPWPKFKDFLYSSSEGTYSYVLLNFSDLVSKNNGLMIGSTGDKVISLQQNLKETGFYNAEIDGRYGLTTESAVLKSRKK